MDYIMYDFDHNFYSNILKPVFLLQNNNYDFSVINCLKSGYKDFCYTNQNHIW